MELSISESSLSRRARLTIGLIAFIQGLGLFYLHHALDNHLWPDGSAIATTMFGMFLIVVPGMIVMTYRDDYEPKRYWPWIVVAAIIFLWLAYHNAASSDSTRFYGERFYFLPACALLAFISLFFLKAWMRDGHWPPKYETQFGFSWHNFLAFALAWLFTLIFWLVLQLWGALFKVVDIDLFQDIFREEWFFYPVLSLAFAYAVVIFRTKINAVGAVQRILRSLISVLLPLLLIIAVMFVSVLPFTGVDLIWQKGYGSDTLLGFVGLSLFFFNAVYQDAKTEPYSYGVSSFLKYSLLVLNVLVLLAAYGVWLRVAQYGLTIERILAIVIVFVIFCYSALYSLTILSRPMYWEIYFGKVNTSMALLVSLIIVLLFTPVLDMARLSVDSQLARLERNEVSLETFDFAYLARSGTYGLRKLEELKQRPDIAKNEKLLKKVESAIENKYRRYYRPDTIVDPKVLAAKVEVFPSGAVVPQDFWNFASKQSRDAESCLKNRCFLLAVDLNKDGVDEYLLFRGAGNQWVYSSHVYKKGGEHGYISQYISDSLNIKVDDLVVLLTENKVELKEPNYMNLKIGDKLLNTSSARDQY